MRRAAPFAAIVFLLLTVACGTGARKNDEDVQALRAAMPSIAAYWADHNAYTGMTLSKLRQIDYGLPEIRIVDAKKRAYCIEINVKGSSAFKRGPAEEIESGTCPR